MSLSNPEHHMLWGWAEEKRKTGKIEAAKKLEEPVKTRRVVSQEEGKEG